jgi:hypothetical protein
VWPNRFDNFCNCEFAYGAGIQEVFSGDRPFWFARRTPVTQFTKVELRYFRADPWTDISGQPLSADEEKGLIHFGYTLGRNPLQVRLTYNGGFFWEQKEPGDVGYPTAVPADITNNAAGIHPAKFLLPLISFAFFLQVRKVWESVYKIGDKIFRSGTTSPALDLDPGGRHVLDGYKRYQLT